MARMNSNTTNKIPNVGLGTYLMKPAEAEQAVCTALQNGYSLIDTASIYRNERAVGRGMKRSGLDRSQIYLSTKIWPTEYSAADKAIEETLVRLDTDYIDLLFLHRPVKDYMSAYQAMERAVKSGKVKTIGLSNFSLEETQRIVNNANILPAIAQVEAHPYCQQTELKNYLKTIGSAMMAWYPLGHGNKELIQESLFTELANKYNKSNAQIILRWHTQVGNIVIPGTKNPAHMKENLEVSDFTLTEQELESIAKLDKNTPYFKQSKLMLEIMCMFPSHFNKQK